MVRSYCAGVARSPCTGRSAAQRFVARGSLCLLAGASSVARRSWRSRCGAVVGRSRPRDFVKIALVERQADPTWLVPEAEGVRLHGPAEDQSELAKGCSRAGDPKCDAGAPGRLSSIHARTSCWPSQSHTIAYLVTDPAIRLPRYRRVWTAARRSGGRGRGRRAGSASLRLGLNVQGGPSVPRVWHRCAAARTAPLWRKSCHRRSERFAASRAV